MKPVIAILRSRPARARDAATPEHRPGTSDAQRRFGSRQAANPHGHALMCLVGDPELAAGRAGRTGLLRPGAEDLVLVRADGAVAVAVVHLVAVAQGHALGGEERPEERRDA